MKDLPIYNEEFWLIKYFVKLQFIRFSNRNKLIIENIQTEINTK